jgi:hypothetical protein
MLSSLPVRHASWRVYVLGQSVTLHLLLCTLPGLLDYEQFSERPKRQLGPVGSYLRTNIFDGFPILPGFPLVDERYHHRAYPGNQCAEDNLH